MKKKKKLPKKITLGKLKAKADALYSKQLRIQAADGQGNVKCYTCNKVDNWKHLQCGHFVSRTFSSLRYFPKNTKVQCIGCNMFNQGRLDVFAINLIKEYGQDILQELQKMKTLPPLNRTDLEELIASYKNLKNV